MSQWNKFFLKGLFYGSPFLFFFSTLSAQVDCNYVLEGYILDSYDGQPLVDARVEIIDLQRNISTNQTGFFSLDGLCSGSYEVLFTHTNCDPLRQIVKLPADEKLVFRLEHHVTALEEIIVAEQGQGDRNSSIKSGLDQKKINENQTENLANALSALSGVSVLQTGSSLSKPVIHGMFGSRVGIVIDGTRLQDQEWGSDHAPTVDINAADFIDVVKGSGALRYGGDTPGGVVILKNMPKTLQDTLSVRVGSSFQTNGRGGALLGKGFGANDKGQYVKFNTTFQQIGDRKAPDYNLTNTGHQEQAFSLILGQKKTAKGWEASYRWYQTSIGILRAAHVGNVGDLARAITRFEPAVINPFSYAIGAPRQESQHHNGKVHYFYRVTNNTKWEINYNIQWNQRKEYDVRRGDDLARPAIDLQLWTHDLEGYFLHHFKDSFKLSASLSGKFQDNYSNPNTGVKRLIPDYQKQQFGFFSNLNYEPNNWLSLDLGFRLDQVFYQAKKYYDRQDWLDRGYDEDFANTPITAFGNQWLAALNLAYFNFSASLGLRYTLIPKNDIYLNFHHSERPPNPSELFSDGLHHALATIEYGNLRLGNENVDKVSIAWKRRSNKFQGETSLYFSGLKNFMVNEPIGLKQTVRGAFPVWQYRAVNGFLWGWDLNVLWQISAIWSYQWSSSAIMAQDQSRNQPLIDIPPFNTSQEFRWESKQKKGWFVALKNRYTARQKRYPNNNFTFTQLESGALTATVIDISTPPAAFSLWDVNAQIRIQPSPHSFWDFRLAIKNLTNVAYRNYLNRLRFYADEMGRNIEIAINYNF